MGASIVGGMTRADQIMIAVTVLQGCTVAGGPPGRMPATSSPSPAARAGPQRLTVLGRGFRSPRVLVEAYGAPNRRTTRGRSPPTPGATSMIDVSDGLLADAGHLATDSGVAIDIRRSAFEVPEPLVAVGAATNADPLSFILGGGEDHALLAAFPDEGSVPAGWT